MTGRVTRSIYTSSFTETENEEQKNKRLQLASKCQNKAKEIRNQNKTGQVDNTTQQKDSTSKKSDDDYEEDEQGVFVLSGQNIRLYAKDLRLFIREEMDAQGVNVLPTDVL